MSITNHPAFKGMDPGQDNAGMTGQNNSGGRRSPLSVIRKQVYLAWVAQQRKPALVASKAKLRKHDQVNFEILGLIDVESFTDGLATRWLRENSCSGRQSAWFLSGK